MVGVSAGSEHMVAMEEEEEEEEEGLIGRGNK